MNWLREVFSENGQGSFSRLASALHTMGGLGWITHFVVHTHQLPDAVTLGGIAAFTVAPYAANKAAGAISSFSNGNGNGVTKPNTATS